MKKLLSIFALLVMFSGMAKAQFGSGVKLPLAVGDTIKNTTAVSKVITATGGYSGATIQVILTNQTGTSAGIVRLFGSTNNGVTYDRMLATDSLLIGTGNSTHHTFIVAGPLPPYLKVVAQGSGTSNTLVAVWYTLRKYSTTP